jgi:hypothetical protein
MLRRVLLVVMATVVSYVLTACGGYILNTISEGRSEGHLALMVRLLFNPLIALAVGVLVGLLSSDRPALTSVVGLNTVGANASRPRQREIGFRPECVFRWDACLLCTRRSCRSVRVAAPSQIGRLIWIVGDI